MTPPFLTFKLSCRLEKLPVLNSEVKKMLNTIIADFPVPADDAKDAEAAALTAILSSWYNIVISANTIKVNPDDLVAFLEEHLFYRLKHLEKGEIELLRSARSQELSGDRVLRNSYRSLIQSLQRKPTSNSELVRRML